MSNTENKQQQDRSSLGNQNQSQNITTSNLLIEYDDDSVIYSTEEKVEKLID